MNGKFEWVSVIVFAFGVGAFIFAAGVIIGVHLGR